MSHQRGVSRRTFIKASGALLALTPAIAIPADPADASARVFPNDFFGRGGGQQFTLSFAIGAGETGTLEADNQAFSVQMTATEVVLAGHSCRQKPKPVTVARPPGPVRFLLIWASADKTARLDLLADGKPLLTLGFKSPANHASPLLRHFTQVRSNGFARLDLRGIGVALTPDEARSLKAALPERQASSCIGPYVGQVRSDAACVWMRVDRAGRYRMALIDAGGKDCGVQDLDADDAADFTITGRYSGLSPATTYRYTVTGPGLAEAGGSFRTPVAGNQGKVRLLLGSCSPCSEHQVFATMAALKPDMVFFMGDTPYIDHQELAVMRHSHRQFLSIPSMKKLLATTPFSGTWDDHDFGMNDSDGTFKARASSGQVFREYRPQFSYGNGREGVYSQVRFGPVEVFLLDCRWFSATGPSPLDPAAKTLLGEDQWRWIQQALKASDATFKVLACGMIWDDKRGTEKDHWATYPAERAALLAFIKRERISGVLLFGGDIHVSRQLQYGTEEVGYPLYQLISSPMHDSTIASLNVPHPALQWAALEKHTFLCLDVDHTTADPVLTARFLDQQGDDLHRVELRAADLRA
jgi:alkaline phosphatase D